jgi:two-component system sensor histidine kinase CpxA
MNSLFLRMFVWFCGATTLVVLAIAASYTITNPDQLPFGWPDVGRGAIVSAGRVSAEAYERGGRDALAEYLASLARDTGLNGHLFDSSGRELEGGAIAPELLADLGGQPEGQLVFRRRSSTAGVRIRAGNGRVYTFITGIPRRARRPVWSRMFVVAMVLSGALLCYMLARHISSPIAYLRGLTSRFSAGDLSARVVSARVLGRKDEIGGLARDFNHMAARIESLVKAEQRLIADVSHELRSPLTRLSLALGLLRRGGDAVDPRMSLSRMEREVERLNALIGQLLTLSRLDALDRPPQMEEIDLAGLVQEIAADADFEAASMDRGVRLAECAACTVSGVADLLRSAVENVVRNGLKYTDPNTEVLIELLHPRGTPSAMILVEDRGPGVPARALDRMFEPFYRVDNARDRRTGGVGLGLAITHQIVTLHGGSVSAANRKEGGLQIRITLPVVSL